MGEIQKILLRQGRGVEGAAGEGNALAALQRTAADHARGDPVFPGADGFQQKLSVVQQDVLPGNERRYDDLRNGDTSGAEKHILSSAEDQRPLECADTQLRPLQVDQKLRLCTAALSGAAEAFDLLRRVVKRDVGKIEAHAGHPGIKHLHQNIFF